MTEISCFFFLLISNGKIEIKGVYCLIIYIAYTIYIYNIKTTII